MSRYNVFKVLREVFREFKGFGSEEMSVLKKQLEEQKQQLERLKVTRQERLRREEALALSELRRAVESLQLMDNSLKQHEQMLLQALNDMERQAKVSMEGAMRQRAADILRSIDYEKIISGDADVEHMLKQQQQQQQGAAGAAGAGGGGQAGGQAQQQQGGQQQQGPASQAAPGAGGKSPPSS